MVWEQWEEKHRQITAEEEKFLQFLLRVCSESEQPLYYQEDSSFRKEIASLAEYQEVQINVKKSV